MSNSKKVEKTEAVTEEKSILANISGVYAYDDTKIKWLVEKNPKRPSGKAHARFELYMKAKTVGEYLTLGGSKADLNYDANKGFLELIS